VTPSLLPAVLIALAAGISVPAAAQSVRSDSTPISGPGISPSNFLDAAQNVVNAIDRYEMATVWDVSSPIMKASIARDAFVANIAQKRALLGSIRSRDWTAIMRVPIEQANGPLPAGRYVSVRFATMSQNGGTAEEVISFSLDRDGQWRLAGYTIQ
jgi:hypothetical protein